MKFLGVLLLVSFASLEAFHHHGRMLLSRHKRQTGHPAYATARDAAYAFAYEAGQCWKDVLSEATTCNRCGNSPYRDLDTSVCSTYTYRTMNGTCNNLVKPIKGAAMIDLMRFIDPIYGANNDDIAVVDAGTKTPREISVAMSNSGDAFNTNSLSLLCMQWGQFLSHDIVLTTDEVDYNSADGTYSPIPCCLAGSIGASANEKYCKYLDFSNDVFYSALSVECGPLIRTLPSPKSCRLGYREQMNLVTSFIDGSAVYGSSDDEATAIRTLSKGALNTHATLEDLGACQDDIKHCNLPSYVDSDADNTVMAGDERVLTTPGLVSIHTLFVRLHNFLANKLYIEGAADPAAGDEIAFQESRKIVGAVIQRITFEEFLPLLVGTTAMKKQKLLLEDYTVHSSAYNIIQNPRVYNSLATAAFRFGHSMITGKFTIGSSSANTEAFLKESFDNYTLTTNDKYFTSYVLQGMAKSNSEGIDSILDESVTNFLGASYPWNHGNDLFSKNIMRGRDHGLPLINAWRTECELPEYTEDWDSMIPYCRQEAIDALKTVYASPLHVELYSGGLAETPEDLNDLTKLGLLGPTFRCIVGGSFRRLKLGDRFWFENDGDNIQFDTAQMEAIKYTDLAHLLCELTSGITNIQPRAMESISEGNPETACASLPNVDKTIFAQIAQFAITA